MNYRCQKLTTVPPENSLLLQYQTRLKEVDADWSGIETKKWDCKWHSNNALHLQKYSSC